MRIFCAFLLAAALTATTACNRDEAGTAQPVAPAAKVENRVSEADLATIKLSAVAVEKLGIATVPVELGPVSRARTFAGDVVVPPGADFLVTAPVAGRVAASSGALPSPGVRLTDGQPVLTVLPMLTPQRDLKVTAEAELQAARVRLEAAQTRLARAEKMLRDQVGSVRAVETAQEEVRVVEAAFNVAKQKLDQIVRAPLDADVSVRVVSPHTGVLRQIQVAEGQVVSAGAPLFQVSDLDPLWIRVPVYSGDMAQVRRGAAAPRRASPA